MAQSFRIMPGRVSAGFRWIVILLLVALLSGCEWCTILDNTCECDPDAEQCDDNSSDTDTQIAGLNIAFSLSEASVTWSRLQNRITARPESYIVEQVDYERRATAIGETLATTGVVVLAAPAFAVPLIQTNPLAGLSLPQAMIVYQDGDEVAVAFNDPAWLRERYALENRDQALAAMDDLLTLLAQRATLDSVSISGSAAGVSREEGIVVSASNADFSTTVARLTTAIRTQAGLNLVQVFDHEANAARIGSNVNPARLFLFLDLEPALELIRAHQTIAVNLPLRMLVYQEDDGDVRIAYNDPAYLAERHGIDTGQAAVDEITDALETLADTAANGP